MVVGHGRFAMTLDSAGEIVEWRREHAFFALIIVTGDQLEVAGKNLFWPQEPFQPVVKPTKPMPTGDEESRDASSLRADRIGARQPSLLGFFSD